MTTQPDVDATAPRLLPTDHPEYDEAARQDVERSHADTADVPHAGHYSRLTGAYWCDTCDSPYCDLA